MDDNMSKKAHYKAFNKVTKHTLRNMMCIVPDMSSYIDLAIIIMKATKLIGYKLPFKYYKDIFDNPYGERMRCQDTAFFTSDSFYLEGYPEVTAAIKDTIEKSSTEKLNTVWELLDCITEARDNIITHYR